MRYFKRKEFACKCGCGFNVVDYELMEVLVDLRKHFNSPITITSGCRCSSHNKKVGGKSRSYHLLGVAADIQIRDVLPENVAEYLDNKYPDKYGIGNYQSFTHIDVRSIKGRW